MGRVLNKAVVILIEMSVLDFRESLIDGPFDKGRCAHDEGRQRGKDRASLMGG